MTPLTTLADATDIYTARTVMETLRKAGYIIVRKDAIERAQREAVAAYRENTQTARLAELAEARYGQSEFPIAA